MLRPPQPLNRCPNPLATLLPVTLNASFLTSMSSDLHPAFSASSFSSFSSMRSLSKVIASFNLVYSPQSSSATSAGLSLTLPLDIDSTS